MDKLYITYRELVSTYGISQKTIDGWVERGIVKTYKEYGNTSVLYDSIPYPSRCKMPSKKDILDLHNKRRIDGTISFYHDRMIEAKDKFI